MLKYGIVLALFGWVKCDENLESDESFIYNTGVQVSSGNFYF